jgi:hypothetical protein
MKSYYHQFILGLQRLKADHPTYTLGKHIATIIDDSDLWGISDKDMFAALKKYEKQLEMDVPHEDDVDEIIKDGLNLDKIIEELHNGEGY